jgi:hypothetical protein
MKYLYISLICILVSTGTFAQNNGLTALPKNDNADELKSFAYNNLNFKQITKSDGLSDNVVTGIVQDQFGFM